MRTRAENHGTRKPARRARGTRAFAALLIAVVGCAQLAASWHEVGVRHVRCAEHGEMTHVAEAFGAAAAPADVQANGTPPAVEGSEASTPAEHDHCGAAFTFRSGAQVQVVRVAVRFTPPTVAVVRRAGAPAPRPGRAIVLASAPKTSPPAG